MNKTTMLIGTILAITAISIPMIISETSPKSQIPNCELPENVTEEQIELLIESGCNIDISSDIWTNSGGIGNWTGTAKYVEHEIIGFNIETQDDLTEIVGLLVDEMYEKEIFLSMKDIRNLSGLDRDMDQIRLTPNDMNGFSNGKTTWHDSYALKKKLTDGTRTYDKFSNNGTLLKSIRINDEPEKEILILLK